MNRLTITRPDDWHVHFRDGAEMRSVVPFSAKRFRRAIVMPNLEPPVVTVEQALAYRQRIADSLPAKSRFQPLMTLYLTDNTAASEVTAARENGQIYAAKLYPAGATTNSGNGVTDIKKIYPLCEAMAVAKLPLLVHGEDTDPTIDVFDREKKFIDRVLAPLTHKFPELKVIFEHATTGDAVEFVRHSGDNIAATITAHHLLLDRNAMFDGGMKPHYYCLPVLKRGNHRDALLDAATSGEKRFFLGTDSAPHARSQKESACGCAGIFSAHAAIELYAQAFEAAGALDKLEAFASFYGADFYGLPRNTEKITLVREPWTVPERYDFGDDKLVPLMAGETINWRLAEADD